MQLKTKGNKAVAKTQGPHLHLSFSHTHSSHIHTYIHTYITHTHNDLVEMIKSA